METQCFRVGAAIASANSLHGPLPFIILKGERSGTWQDVQAANQNFRILHGAWFVSGSSLICGVASPCHPIFRFHADAFPSVCSAFLFFYDHFLPRRLVHWPVRPMPPFPCRSASFSHIRRRFPMPPDRSFPISTQIRLLSTPCIFLP